ncbi:hypothetical protein NS220_08375 [Microbacterium testaceum]|uniref:Uncharacterized protein n=1 Tax=Microbacterium testaceum TaxID=2033 RepID=A0A147EXJ5_MICTE|nr:hypothetical protein NS220_08375 [Microbacterium testaceum]
MGRRWGRRPPGARWAEAASSPSCTPTSQLGSRVSAEEAWALVRGSQGECRGYPDDFVVIEPE